MLPIIENAKKEILDALVGFSSSFEEWKTPWTQDRAEKLDSLDNLDVPVSTRASVETQEALLVRMGTPGSTDMNTVMGKVQSLLGFGQFVEYKNPGSHNFTVPAGVSKLTVTLMGAGGGGGSGGGALTNMSSSYPVGAGGGGGGGGGSYALLELPVTPGQSYQIVVGAAGSGGQPADQKERTPEDQIGNTGRIGGTGGASSFGQYVASGGSGGRGGGGARNDEFTSSAGTGGSGGTLGSNIAAVAKESSAGSSGVKGGSVSRSEYVRVTSPGAGGGVGGSSGFSATVGKGGGGGKGGSGTRAEAPTVYQSNPGENGTNGYVSISY